MRDVLRLRDLRLLLASVAVAQAGDWLFGAALLVYMLDATGSAFWVAAVGVVRLVPWVVLSPVAGVLADRVSRRAVLLVSSLGQAAAMAAMAAVALAGGSPSATLAMAAVAAAAAVASSPAVAAALPLMGDERHLPAINSWRSAILSASMVLGPAIGAVLLILGSPAVAFGANAACLLVSGGLVALIRADMGPLKADREAENAASEPGARGPAALVRATTIDLVAGARALVSSARTFVLVAAAAGVFFAYTAQVVLWAVLADEHLGAGADALTILYVAYGIGGVLATVPAGRAVAGREAGRTLAGALVVGALGVVALAQVTDLLPAVVLVGLQGMVVTIADVLGMTLLQRSLGAAVLGRAMGALDSATSVAMVLGSMLAPVLLAGAGLTGGFVIVGCFLAAVGVVALVVLRRPAGLPTDAAERLGRLAESPLFAATPRFALEGLALDSREIRVAAGTILIREGEAPDNVYVVVAGAASVTVDPAGVIVNTLGPGDVFGEIGLVRGTPRTATVTMTASSTLLRIPGERFLEAVGSGAVHGAALGRTVGQRLARTRRVA